jgi:hypothetical protein
VVYGPSTVLVYTTGHGVHGFTLDPTIGAFVLTNEHMKMPEQGKYYSVNEANAATWPEEYREYVGQAAHRRPGRQYSSRYIGSLVADFHRTLLKGGVFLYPPTQDQPGGKLRLLYEANPLAFIAEQAGGMASSGRADPRHQAQGSTSARRSWWAASARWKRLLKAGEVSRASRMSEAIAVRAHSSSPPSSPTSAWSRAMAKSTALAHDAQPHPLRRRRHRESLHAVARSGTRIEVPVLAVVVDDAGDLWHVVEKPLAAGLLAAVLRALFLLCHQPMLRRLLPRGLQLAVQPLQPHLQPLHLIRQRNDHIGQRIADLMRIGDQHPLAAWYTMCAGTPTTVESGGTSRTTTDPHPPANSRQS